MALPKGISYIDLENFRQPTAFEGLDSLFTTIANHERQQNLIEKADEQQAYQREQVEINRQREDEQQGYIRVENEKTRQIQNEALLFERKNFELNEIDRDYGNDLMGKALALQALQKTNPDFKGDLSLDVRANQLINQSETLADSNEAFTKLYLNPDATVYDYEETFNKVDLGSLPPVDQQIIGQQYIQNFKVQQEKEQTLISQNPMLLGLAGRLKTLSAAGKFESKEFKDISSKYTALLNQLKTPSPVAKDQISIDDLSEEKRRYIFSLDDKGEIDLEDLTLGEQYESEEALAQALGISFEDMISMPGDLKPGDAGYLTKQAKLEEEKTTTEGQISFENAQKELNAKKEEIKLLESDRKFAKNKEDLDELNLKIKDAKKDREELTKKRNELRLAQLEFRKLRPSPRLF
mgnify:FL=1